MIPLKLQIKNFLSYGCEAQIIDFSPYHLICLSGKNGHGKSALLDAITWALWGQARKTLGVAKADQGLLRLGQTQMFVALDFMFNGQTYRVRREFAKTYGKPFAALDFGVMNQETQQLIPLTDKTIRQTQEKIESLLNLDIDSFVNSAFLRQGQSNEFSKKTAKERKLVLATILGLNRYETIRALALEKVRDAHAKKDALSAIATNIELELRAKDSITVQLNVLQEKILTLKQEELALESNKKNLEQQRLLINQDHNKQQHIVFQQQQVEDEEKTLIATLKTVVQEWRTTHKAIRTLDQQQDLEMKKRTLINEINNHQTTLQHSLELKEKKLVAQQELYRIHHQIKEQLTTTIAAKKAQSDIIVLKKTTLETQVTASTHQLARYEQDRSEIKQEIITLQKKILEATVQQCSLDGIEKQFERRKDYYQKFVAQGSWIKQELDNLLQKNQLVHDDANPSCPLCDQNLSATRKRFLKKQFELQEHLLTHRISRLKKVALALKAILIEQHAQMAILKKAAADSVLSSAALEETNKRLVKLDAALEQEKLRITQDQAQLTQVLALYALDQQEMLAVTGQEPTLLLTSSEYQHALASLAKIDDMHKKLQYDPLIHQETQNALLVVEQKLKHYDTLTEQTSLQTQRSLHTHEICKNIKKLRSLQQGYVLALKEYALLPDRLKALVASEQQLAQLTVEFRNNKDVLLHEQGSLENQKNKYLSLEQEYLQHQETVKKLDAFMSDYQTIATASGKDGIQALLIEEAIPEIEQEANQLLAKLTNNTAQIFIESLRDLKSGGTKETLDIKISDNIGIRSYEMFSGGEAFRIDFALRIAISKLLARRAGTSLQTLIIDEGFGSQDEEGLGAIMDALYAIQEDFSKIIIVSHLSTMKDQFPVHFLVDKGPNGSMVHILEQG